MMEIIFNAMRWSVSATKKYNVHSWKYEQAKIQRSHYGHNKQKEQVHISNHAKSDDLKLYFLFLEQK